MNWVKFSLQSLEFGVPNVYLTLMCVQELPEGLLEQEPRAAPWRWVNQVRGSSSPLNSVKIHAAFNANITCGE